MRADKQENQSSRPGYVNLYYTVPGDSRYYIYIYELKNKGRMERQGQTGRRSMCVLITTDICQVLLQTRHSAKHFTCTIILNPHQHSLRQLLNYPHLLNEETESQTV